MYSVGRHCVVAVEIDIAADAEMLDADELGDVIVMIEDVFDGGGLVGFNEHANVGDAHNAAFGGHCFDGLVGFAARMIGI